MRARMMPLLLAGIVVTGCTSADDVLDRPNSLVEMHGLAAQSAPVLTLNWPASVPTYDDGTFVVATAQPDGSATALWETTKPVLNTADEYDAALIARGFLRDSEQIVAAHLVRDYLGPRHRITVITTRSGALTSLAVKVATAQ